MASRVPLYIAVQSVPTMYAVSPNFGRRSKGISRGAVGLIKGFAMLEAIYSAKRTFWASRRIETPAYLVIETSRTAPFTDSQPGPTSSEWGWASRRLIANSARNTRSLGLGRHKEGERASPLSRVPPT